MEVDFGDWRISFEKFVGKERCREKVIGSLLLVFKPLFRRERHTNGTIDL